MKKATYLLLGAMIGSTAAFAVDFGKHPQLEHAHKALENAKKQLEQANDKKKTEFGGHRAAAVEHINQAQHEIEQAAEYANDPANK